MKSPKLQAHIEKLMRTAGDLAHTRVLSPIKLDPSGRAVHFRLRQTGEIEDRKGSPKRKHLLELIPEPMAQRIVDHGITFKRDSQESRADGNIVQIAYTHDFFHELGHAWWQYIMLTPQERKRIQKTAIHKIGADSERIPLKPVEIPAPHQEYAKLVSAHSGQFIFNDTYRGRYNDLEEHFARNVQNVVLCRPLEVTMGDGHTEEKLLEFFLKHGIIDEQHALLYRKINQKVLRLTRNPREVTRAGQANPVQHEEIYDLLKKIRAEKTRT